MLWGKALLARLALAFDLLRKNERIMRVYMKASCTTALLFWSLEHASSRFATGVAIRYGFLVYLPW